MDKFKGISNSAIKTKRKELDEFNDDFSDFSLSSPARKIRRLDAELPPIVEEDDVDIQMRCEQGVPDKVTLNGVDEQFKMPDIEELPPSVSENEERAMVLFKPVDALQSYFVDPNLLASFKNKAFWRVKVNRSELREVDEGLTDEDNEGTSSCRAVIPWVPAQQPNLKPEVVGSQMDTPDAMEEAEETEATEMEIEDSGPPQSSEFYHLPRLTTSHCTFPQPLENTTTPVVWFR